MTSRTTERFRDSFLRLPAEIQRRAREAYVRFANDPSYPGLRYKQVHPTEPVYSVRITADYRAVGVRDGDVMVWFWIGSHSEYEGLLASL